MSLGSLFISSLDADLPVHTVRLQAGGIAILAMLDGPVRIPASTFPATLYGEDGLQVAVVTCTLVGDLVLEAGERAGLTTMLQVETCIPT